MWDRSTLRYSNFVHIEGLYSQSHRVNFSTFMRMAHIGALFIRLTCNLGYFFEILYSSHLWCWNIFYIFWGRGGSGHRCWSLISTLFSVSANCHIFSQKLSPMFKILSLKYKEYKLKKQILQESSFKIFIHNAQPVWHVLFTLPEVWVENITC